MPSDLLDRLHEITVDDAWGGSDGAGVKVAIVDSGIEATHDALDDAVRGGIEVVIENDEPRVETCERVVDDFGHGTACAGIVHGVAPGAALYSIKVLGGNCSGRGDAFAAGLEWAIDEGMGVVNLSLGTTNRRYLKSFYELADRAYYEGCILVAAANNVPPPSIPSLCSSLISVDCDDFADDRSQFTFHPGRLIEIDAHGINVLAPWVNGSFRHVTGTSFAAPHVTGLVARLRAKHPELTPFQIKTVLCAIGRQTSTASNAIARGAGARTVRARRQSVAQNQQP